LNTKKAENYRKLQHFKYLNTQKSLFCVVAVNIKYKTASVTDQDRAALYRTHAAKNTCFANRVPARGMET
jgi:hypothetical protein